ncbi:MAG: alpha/beta hydrolase [Chloroflexota bacterium]
MKILLGFVVVLVLLGVYIWANYFTSSLSYEQLSEYAYETLVLDNGMQVNYRLEGNPEGQTMLLIHGGFDSLDGWDSWTSTFAKDFNVVSVDMPGHGLTDPLPERDYTRYGMAAFIKRFVDALALPELIIIGHSMGGEHSLQYAIENPDMVKGIVIVAAGGYVDDAAVVETEQELLKLANSPIAPVFYYYGTEADIKGSFAEYMNMSAEKEPEFFNRIYQLSRYEKHRDTSLKMISSMYKNPHNIRGLDTITAPTLIVWGDKDTVALPEHAVRFDNDIKDSTLIMYEGVAHGLQLETGENGAKDVVEFIKDRGLDK